MTQQTHQVAPPVVCLDETKNLDKTITLARFGARKDHVTVVIQRTRVTKRGDTRRTPILEVTPAGDVLEISAPRLRTPISAFLTDSPLNVRAGKGQTRFAEVVKMSRDYVAAEAEQEANRRTPRRDRQHASPKTAA